MSVEFPPNRNSPQMENHAKIGDLKALILSFKHLGSNTNHLKIASLVNIPRVGPLGPQTQASSENFLLTYKYA